MKYESFIWSWLTYGWLIKNLGVIVIFLLIGIAILFMFPLILGYDMKKEADKKEVNKEE
tara:strand:- start:604 stop:780 length:177 start_codon:yes stop_codon:yes gene_type:complete